MNYIVQRGPFQKPSIWTLEAGDLVETHGDKARRWPLSTLRAFRLASGTNRYAPGEQIVRAVFRKGAATFGSHSFAGLGAYRDQTRDFGAFVRDLAAAAKDAAPSARFESGTAAGAGIFNAAAAILGAGVVLILLGAVAAGQISLGAELCSRLGFVLILMFAISPWLPGARSRAFDPCAIPADLLP